MSVPKSVKGNILTTQNHTNKSGYVKTFRAKLWLENKPWLRTEVMETKRHFKCETPLFLYISKLVNDSQQQQYTIFIIMCFMIKYILIC